MRFSFSIKANRTKPSPPGPKPTPGESATSHSFTISEQKSTDERSVKGNRTSTTSPGLHLVIDGVFVVVPRGGERGFLGFVPRARIAVAW